MPHTVSKTLLKTASHLCLLLGLCLGVLLNFGCGSSRPERCVNCIPDGEDVVSTCVLATDCSPSQTCISGHCTSGNSDLPNSDDSENSTDGSGSGTGSEVTSCRQQTQCPANSYCDLISAICVSCLVDDHCAIGTNCIEHHCLAPNDSPTSSGGNGSGAGSGSPTPTPAQCNATSTTESGIQCSDGRDNDCDGVADSFDTDCHGISCGTAAHAMTTNNCSPEYPVTIRPLLCEQYPNATSMSGAASSSAVTTETRCMEVCRSRSDCPAGYACYPSRRSINLHFCAPALSDNIMATGEICSQDDQCASALCHHGTGGIGTEGRCREVCVRDADCGGGDKVCRAEIRTHAFIGNEIATGVCLDRDPAKKGLGATCTSAAECQFGICRSPYAGSGAECSKPCGSAFDCGVGERCAPAAYDRDPTIGFGMRACGPAPITAYQNIGQTCVNGGQSVCRSFFCDSTYYINAVNQVIPPFCSGHCDTDSDCPLLFPGEHDLRMRCLIASSGDINPLIGGFCAPHWCETSLECPQGTLCSTMNLERWGGAPQGICK